MARLLLLSDKTVVTMLSQRIKRGRAPGMAKTCFVLCGDMHGGIIMLLVEGCCEWALVSMSMQIRNQTHWLRARDDMIDGHSP